MMNNISLFESTWWLPVLVITFLFMYLVKQKARRSNLPPSPPKLPIIGNLHQLGKLPHRSLWQLAQNYGPVMLLELGSASTLVISSATMAKEILKTQDLNFYSRPHTCGGKRLTYNFSDVALSPYSHNWREKRKIFVSELLSSKRAHLFQEARETEVDHLINSLFSKPDSTPVNLDEKLCNLVYRTICVVAFGKRSSYKEGDQFKDAKLKHVIDEGMEVLDGLSAEDFFPWIGRILDSITGQRARLEKCFRQLDDYFQMVIDEHLEETNIKLDHDQDFVDSLIEISKGEKEPFRLTKDHIKAMFLNAFLGGVDTSSVTMAWAMSELVKNPRVIQKLQAEVRHLVGRKSQVKEDDLPKLTYLKMVMKETLRLHPPAPFLIPRESMCHSEISGYDVYPKTRVLVNAWGIGRDPSNWKNPNEFYPERFEENNIDFRGQHFELLPFGAGRRFCPGVNLAVSTIELTLANLLCCFDWEIPSGMKMEDISMEEKYGLVVRRKTPLCLVPIEYNWLPDL